MSDVKEQTPAASDTGAGVLRRPNAAQLERWALPAVWLLIAVIFAALRPDTFLSTGNLSGILASQAVIVVLALAATVPLTSGDFDVSIAFNMTMASMIVAILNVNWGLPVGVAITAAIGTGLVVGWLNGLFIVRFGVDSLIATLGTGTFIGGVTLWISGSNTISGISRALVTPVVRWRFLGIPLSFFYALALCTILWVVLSRTALGRRLLFSGRGPDVAKLAGVNVPRLRWGALVVSGVGSALAGVMYAGTTGGADPVSGNSFLLPAFAACFLGSTTIKPGRFNAWGTFAAVYFLATGITGLQLLGVRSFIQSLFYGGALVLAVTLSQFVRRRGATTRYESHETEGALDASGS